jgi:hypothetical protein
MRMLWMMLSALIALMLTGCGSSPQEDFAQRVGQAMKAPASDSTSSTVLTTMRRVAFAAANVPDTPSITPDQLFDWAEATYPQFFPTKEKTLTWSVYQFRYYKDTDVYLAVESGQKVVALGKPTQGNFLELGNLSVFTQPVYEYSVTAKSNPINLNKNSFQIDFGEDVSEVYFTDAHDVDKDGVDDFVISAAIDPYKQIGVMCCEVTAEQVKQLRGISPKLYLSNFGAPRLVDFPNISKSHRTWSGKFFKLRESLYYVHGRNGELGLPDQNIGETTQIYKINANGGRIIFQLIAETKSPKTTASIDVRIRDNAAEILQNNYNIYNKGISKYRTQEYVFDGDKLLEKPTPSFFMKSEIAHNQIIYSKFMEDFVISSAEVWKSYDGREQITVNPASYVANQNTYIDLLPVLFGNNHSGATVGEIRINNKLVIVEVATEFFGHQGGGFKGSGIQAYRVDPLSNTSFKCDVECDELNISMPRAIGSRLRDIDMDFNGESELYLSVYSKEGVLYIYSKGDKLSHRYIKSLEVSDPGGWVGEIIFLRNLKQKCHFAVSTRQNKPSEAPIFTVSTCI